MTPPRPLAESDRVEAQMARAAMRFRERYGRSPRYAAIAPGRVNLIGEHTDYNDGFVLPLAIERQTVIMADRATGTDATVHSTAGEGSARFSVEPGLPGEVPAWGQYVRGVVAGFLDRGLNPGGWDALIDSTVPIGGGLSSSAALEVATATLLEALVGVALDPVEKALLCQHAEHAFAGVPCGIMDPFVAISGRRDHALLIDCASKRYEHVPLIDQNVAVLIFDSGVRHELAGSEYPVRRAQCALAAAALGVPTLRNATMFDLDAKRPSVDGMLFRRARHVVTENDRVQQASAAMRHADWRRVGELMDASHASLRDDFEVSCDELNLLVELARGFTPAVSSPAPVYGARMTGGGFGGCVVALVRAAVANEIAETVGREYLHRTGISSSAFVTRPAAGARTVAL